MSDSQGVERRGWEDELNAAWELVDMWRGRFEDAAARETALHEQLAGMVPSDEAAVERATQALIERRRPLGHGLDGFFAHRLATEARADAEAVLRAAGAQQGAAAKPKASGPDA